MNREEFKKKHGIISHSSEINDLVDVVMQVSTSDITILVYGESGVGKEVFARAIHNSSKRTGKELISVNCGAMPLTTQVKVLRAIEFKEFMRIGAETVTKVDVRIIAATNKDLQEEVDSRRFREDLFFRLKAVSLSIPPLRKRKEDIELLANHFLEGYASANKIASPKITHDAMAILMEYNWPGNVRELKNTIETAVALNRNGVLDIDSFADLIIHREESYSSRNLPVFLRKTPEDADREILYRALFEIKKDLIELKDIVLLNGRETVVKGEEPKKNLFALDVIERDTIKAALDKTRGNKRKASKLLNISERTLYRKIKQYDLIEE